MTSFFKDTIKIFILIPSKTILRILFQIILKFCKITTVKEGEIRNEIETVTKASGGGGKMIGNAFFLPSQFLSV